MYIYIHICLYKNCDNGPKKENESTGHARRSCRRAPPTPTSNNHHQDLLDYFFQATSLVPGVCV